MLVAVVVIVDVIVNASTMSLVLLTGGHSANEDFSTFLNSLHLCL